MNEPTEACLFLHNRVVGHFNRTRDLSSSREESTIYVLGVDRRHGGWMLSSKMLSEAIAGEMIGRIRCVSFLVGLSLERSVHGFPWMDAYVNGWTWMDCVHWILGVSDHGVRVQRRRVKTRTLLMRFA